MRRRILGGTGISVSEYAFGAMMFGALGNPDHEECVRMIHAALDGGINFIDTADVYSAGRVEEIVGKALKGRRDDVVLATKFALPDGDRTRTSAAARGAGWITRAWKTAFAGSDTDYIDLYQMHRPDPNTDIDETLSALSDLVRAGKVRAIGCSVFPAEQIVEAQWAAERRGHVRFRTRAAAVLDPHPGDRDRGAADRADVRHGRADLVAAGQRLAVRAVHRASDVDLTRGRQSIQPHSSIPSCRATGQVAALAELRKLAAELGRPMSHLALAFVRAHPGYFGDHRAADAGAAGRLLEGADFS